MYFNETICGWGDWGKVFQSRAAFAPLVKAVCEREGLPFEPFLNCTPGTNAVFEAGGRIIKVFAPLESGLNTLPDYQSETFGMQRAEKLGLHAARLLAAGELQDRYLFRYLIMQKLPGKSFAQAKKQMDAHRKQEAGKQLRRITDRMNTPCAPWGEPVDVRERALWGERWAPFSESFNRERRAFTKTLSLENPVYVHGDLNEDNLLVDEKGQIAVIDFADSLIAPVCYEQALIASELFQFERPFLSGYFGDCRPEELAELCLSGLLLHDFGGDILRTRLGGIETLHSLDDLRKRLRRRFSEGLK
ncbi:MAG: aminoglycoside phosphotransferase family protein [Provencibacterium sp.]|jgi:hypothetical protein|nr:aminoglycoside phosphotransferase family protein [Provencibacterium sp.]